MGTDKDRIERRLTTYDRTGRRLFLLGLSLFILLGVVTVPLALAVLDAFPIFLEKSEGPVLAGALVGLGLAVAGIFFGAAKMLTAIPAILHARNDNPALPRHGPIDTSTDAA